MLRCRLETIQRIADRFQLCARRGAEILTAGLLGNGAQSRLVEVQARVETEAAEHATFFRHGADADGVDPHAFFGGQRGRQQRLDFATVVGTVGDQYQHTTVRRSLPEAFNRQADGVPYRSVAAGDANPGFVQPDSHGVAIEGQWRLQIGLAAEENQADAIATTLLDEVAEQYLDQFQPRQLLVLPLHVGVIHRAGDVHCQQQIAAAGGQRQWFTQPLGACCGEQQQQPDGQVGQLLAPGGQGDTRAPAGQLLQFVEEADLQRGFAAIGRRQQCAQQPGQR